MKQINIQTKHKGIKQINKQTKAIRYETDKRTDK